MKHTNTEQREIEAIARVGADLVAFGRAAYERYGPGLIILDERKQPAHRSWMTLRQADEQRLSRPAGPLGRTLEAEITHIRLQQPPEAISLLLLRADGTVGAHVLRPTAESLPANPDGCILLTKHTLEALTLAGERLRAAGDSIEHIQALEMLSQSLVEVLAAAERRPSGEPGEVVTA